MLCEILLIFLSFITVYPRDTVENKSEYFFISGAIDVYYAYDFNQPIDQNRQYTTQAARHNEFNINWAYIHTGYENDRVRGNLSLHTGTYVIFNYADEPNPLLRFVAQANAGVRLAPSIWLDAGILPSHIGYENTFSAENEIYTRSLMAENSPYFSTGAQLSARISDKVKASFVVLNGWQNITETNNSKSLGININYTPSSRWELNYSNYWGNEGNATTGRKFRFFNHSYIRYIFTPKFHSAISFDIGRQELFWNTETAIWHTGMVIGQYKFSQKFSLSGRVEYYQDPSQIIIPVSTGRGFRTSSTTLNFNFSPSSNSIIRLEGRMYNAKDYVFNEGPIGQRNNFLIASSLTIHF